ncbi:MAG TPA: MFS transporter, partial [Actinobacteria bacterium]|nr:MFS transporter [Actinomycetota bacterium]
MLFFTNALTLSAWLPRLAELQADISLTNVAVGAALAAGAAGGVAAGIWAGPLIHRW